jgi:hypothetical protein
MQLGILTLGDLQRDPSTGRPHRPVDRMADIRSGWLAPRRCSGSPTRCGSTRTSRPLPRRRGADVRSRYLSLLSRVPAAQEARRPGLHCQSRRVRGRHRARRRNHDRVRRRGHPEADRREADTRPGPGLRSGRLGRSAVRPSGGLDRPLRHRGRSGTAVRVKEPLSVRWMRVDSAEPPCFHEHPEQPGLTLF